MKRAGRFLMFQLVKKANYGSLKMILRQHAEKPTSNEKCEKASQAAEIVNGVYGVNAVTANFVQFWYRRGIFDVKVASRTERPSVENVDKIQK
ncbi:hypothetical protein TNCV_4298341 [Trichonephila clavipes]|nr:hypothetical protein TNCV_4298341 [Trichonephila clavipes]